MWRAYKIKLRSKLISSNSTINNQLMTQMTYDIAIPKVEIELWL